MTIEIWLVHPESEMCEAFRERFAGLPRTTVHECRFEALEPHDCFVTAANSFGMMTAGIDAAVVHYFGDELMQRVQHRVMDEYLGEQPVGTAFLVETDHPRVPFVCHAPTMRVPGSIDGTDNVYNATWVALLAVHAHNIATPERRIETVAFPAFGAGFGGVPYREAARQMAAAYRHYLHPPHRLDWEWVAGRERAICYDGRTKVVKR